MTPLENISVANQALLTQSLPEGSKLLYVDAIDNNTAKIVYTLNGTQASVILNKTNLSGLFGIEPPTVTVSDLCTLNHVWEAFSKATGLGLILNTDYDNDTTTVDLNAMNQPFKTLTLTVSDKSLLYFGKCDIKVIAASHVRSNASNKSIVPSLKEDMCAVALSLIMVHPTSEVFTGNKLTSKYINDLTAVCKNNPAILPGIIADIAAGQVMGIEQFNSCSMFVVKTQAGRLFTLTIKNTDGLDLPVLLTK